MTKRDTTVRMMTAIFFLKISSWEDDRTGKIYVYGVLSQLARGQLNETATTTSHNSGQLIT